MTDLERAADTSDPLEILDAIDRERGESFIGMIQANQVQRLRTEIVALREALHAEHDEALEEAARVVEMHWGIGEATCVAEAIRALKEKRHD